MLFPLSLLLIINLWGCGTNKNTDSKNDVNTTDTEENNMGNSTTGTGDNTTNENNTDSNMNNDRTSTDKSKVEVADDAAGKITEMEEVESANVLVTNENAYVGVMLKEGTTDNKELEDKISEAVRSTHSEFKNVYVSFNPDYAKQLNDYGKRVREGEPVEGFFEEFSDSIERMFPNAR